MHTLNDLKEFFADRSTLSIATEIYGFTGFRTTKLEDLTEKEIEDLYMAYAPKTLDQEFNALKSEMIAKEWKSKILALADKTGIKEKGSFHKFNNWMLTSGKFKKHLNAHSIEQLKELYKQLRGVQHNNGRSAQRPMTNAWWKKADELKQFN